MTINIKERKTTAIILVLILCAGILAGCSAKAGTKAQTPSNKSTDKAVVTKTPETTPYLEMPEEREMELENKPARSPSPEISKTNYEKIKDGMTLEEVEKLLGDKGMRVSTTIAGGRETETYKWGNDDFSRYIDVTIEKGKVIEKKEKGLK